MIDETQETDNFEESENNAETQELVDEIEVGEDAAGGELEETAVAVEAAVAPPIDQQEEKITEELSEFDDEVISEVEDDGIDTVILEETIVDEDEEAEAVAMTEEIDDTVVVASVVDETPVEGYEAVETEGEGRPLFGFSPIQSIILALLVFLNIVVIGLGIFVVLGFLTL